MIKAIQQSHTIVVICFISLPDHTEKLDFISCSIGVMLRAFLDLQDQCMMSFSCVLSLLKLKWR